MIFDTTALFSLPPGQAGAVATAQSRKPKFPLRQTRTTDIAFVRFVGVPAAEANRPWLADWAKTVAGWLTAPGEDVFFFLHNPDDTDAPEMARLLHDLIASRHPLPALPDWETPPAAPQQPTLW